MNRPGCSNESEVAVGHNRGDGHQDDHQHGEDDDCDDDCVHDSILSTISRVVIGARAPVTVTSGVISGHPATSAGNRDPDPTITEGACRKAGHCPAGTGYLSQMSEPTAGGAERKG